MSDSGPSREQPRLSACPLCNHHDLVYQFTHETTPIVRCDACGLLMRNPQPSDAELAAIYTEHYFIGHDPSLTGSADPAGLSRETDRLKRETAAGYLDLVEARMQMEPSRPQPVRLLEIGSGLGNLLVEAQARGYDVTGVEYAEASVRAANKKLGAARVLQGSIGSVALPDGHFDVCILADVLEHTRNPRADLQAVWRVLKTGGALFIAVPSLDSWSAKLLRQRWMEFKVEHLFFFDRQTLQSLLFLAGFDCIDIRSGRKTLSPEYVIQHFERFPVPVVSPVARAGRTIMPAPVRRQRFSIVASGIDVVARRSPEPPPVARRQRLSVVMPVFNERATFPVVIELLLKKEIAGLDVDIIIVESNSTDGTRDAVRSVEGRPRVKVVYEERPRGKGHAVRTGLQHAAGDFILIQDADLEYDLNDYEVLLEPLRTGRAAFVLGARHGMDGKTWKMRHFTDQVLVSQVMNFGHLFFTTLFNVVYGQRLRDPFTMFKVFRRDCLHGLTFESNRFDFDWELVGKLVRSGYTPIEIPVNYESRSFSEGKKVSFWRDPFTYFRACFKYRFVRLQR
jgi:SAM-dependent methyltransferase